MKRLKQFLPNTIALACMGALGSYATLANAAVCEHVIQNEWNSGFVAEVNITNDGNTTINGWQVQFSYADATLGHLWNANVSGSSTITASNLAWNSRIEPGQTVTFGLVGNKNVMNGPTPSAVVIGDVCSSSDTDTDTATDTDPDPDTDTDTATDTDTDTDTATDTDTDTDTDTATDTDTDTESDSDTDTESDSDTDTDTDTESDTDTDTESDTDTDTESDSDTDTESDSDTDTESDSDTDTESDTDTDTESDSDTDTESDSDTDTESDTDTDTESDSDTDTESDSDTDTESDSDTDTDTDTDGVGKGAGFDNPWVGGNYYVNPEWSANALAEPGGEDIAYYNTGVWMDQIAAIEGTTGMGLRDHLDEAVAQGADVIMVIVYDLPNRDCAALASSGELRISEDGFNIYKDDYIAPYAEILSDPAYKDLRIVTIIEVDSLPNLVTNLDIADCQEADGAGGYRDGITHALNEFAKIPNVYSYVDIAHSGWLGWTDNFAEAATLIAEVIEGTDKGWESIAGFASNSSNYTPVEEPYLPDPTLSIGGMPIRSSDFYEWNSYFEEKDFVQDWREAMIAKGAPETIGMLIDTARNGWGGDARPTGASTSTDLNTYVNESKIDQRYHRGNWCNQPGGIGFKPYPDPYEGIDAFVWIKPPGESDGVADPDFEIDPNDLAKRHDPMCDPDSFNTSDSSLPTGALADAPHAGRWFSEGFQVLLANAYPAASEPAAPPPEIPLPTDCEGFEEDDPLFVSSGVKATVDLRCGPVYVEFAETTQTVEFNNTGSEMGVTATYNGTSTVVTGYYQSKSISTSTMTITQNDGGASSLIISYY